MFKRCRVQGGIQSAIVKNSMSVFDFEKEESVLLVGEGNFTFSCSIVGRRRVEESVNFSSFVTTCFEEEENCIISSKVKQRLLSAGKNR